MAEKERAEIQAEQPAETEKPVKQKSSKKSGKQQKNCNSTKVAN